MSVGRYYVVHDVFWTNAHLWCGCEYAEFWRTLMLHLLMCHVGPYAHVALLATELVFLHRWMTFI